MLVESRLEARVTVGAGQVGGGFEDGLGGNDLEAVVFASAPSGTAGAVPDPPAGTLRYLARSVGRLVVG